ncbi:MAG: hypothetical protein CUN51_01700 [Candidatus Thermofonsia Clade 1 bacterium]|uniref:Fibronectin type-III domain-containing protein n=1 Tax=Candidatus Thermofonsia Clade 1 bacterium TaxID=2364210 RepID=A0A2M8P2A6_9CHLR|nr:MAG: hypothetical protein CUN51_01700 [Candidatus Thermofonsia Clade 1 bacterium]
MARTLGKAIGVMVLLGMALQIAPIRGQTELPRLPISALWSDGSRLLIGQGGTLSEVVPTAERLLVSWQIGLGRGALQAIAVCAPFIFVLSADGVSVLDSDRRERAFGRGGGHRIACNGDQVWIAALGAGVRRYRFSPDGRLTALEPIRTTTPAYDVVPSGGTAFWVAEGAEGVRRYNFDGTVQLWLNTFAPAQVVHERENVLYIGHSAQLSILRLSDPLRLIGSASLTPSDATLSDLLIVGNRIYAGRQHASGRGASLIAFELLGSELRLIGQFGEDSDGARLGAVGIELFVVSGSAFTWLRFTEAAPRVVMTWSARAPRCALNIPTDPQPADGAQVSEGSVTLQWRASCAESFELWLDGAMIATVPSVQDAQSDRPLHSYALQLTEGVHRWQVIALDNGGARLASPMWRVSVRSEGLLSTISAPRRELLYQPPPFAVRTPSEALTLLGMAFCSGLLVVIVAAWWLGVRAQRRYW